MCVPSQCLICNLSDDSEDLSTSAAMRVASGNQLAKTPGSGKGEVAEQKRLLGDWVGSEQWKRIDFSAFLLL